MVNNLNENDFEKKVLNNTNTVVVDFYATWCGPCKMLGPVLEKVSESNSNVDFYKINVDENPQAAAEFGVNSIPNVHIFKSGEHIDNFVGYKSESDVQKFIDNAK